MSVSIEFESLEELAEVVDVDISHLPSVVLRDEWDAISDTNMSFAEAKATLDSLEYATFDNTDEMIDVAIERGLVTDDEANASDFDVEQWVSDHSDQLLDVYETLHDHVYGFTDDEAYIWFLD